MRNFKNAQSLIQQGIQAFFCHASVKLGIIAYFAMKSQYVSNCFSIYPVYFSE
jgi:hypothetical protein